MQTISGAELKRMILSAAASIEIHKQDLNELNVFPVPDGDTGTNMSMTIHAAANDLRGVDGSELYAVAKGSMPGGRAKSRYSSRFPPFSTTFSTTLMSMMNTNSTSAMLNSACRCKPPA